MADISQYVGILLYTNAQLIILRKAMEEKMQGLNC